MTEIPPSTDSTAAKPVGRRSSYRGGLTVAVMFLLGGAVLWGLYRAPRAVSLPAPADVPFGVPGRAMRIVSYNISRNQRGSEGVVSEIRSLDPDILMLQEVESRDVAPMADVLGLSRFYHPLAYQRSENLAGRHSTWGVGLLTKFPIYDLQPISSPGGPSFGVWGSAVIDGKKIIVASVHFSDGRASEMESLHRMWKDRGSPPMIIGGDWGKNDDAAINLDWIHSVAFNDTASSVENGRVMLTDSPWKVSEAVVVDAPVSDHRPIRVEVVSMPTK